MKNINFCIRSAFRMINNHKLIFFLMLILISACLAVLGVAFSMGEEVNTQVENYDDTYGKQVYYFTSDGMTDLQYYTYMDDDNVEIYERLLKFHHACLNEKRFVYMDLVEQPIEVYGTEIPDIFLDGYEEGEQLNSIYNMDGKDWYRTKSLQVSDSFFGIFSPQLLEGRLFSEDDYIYERNKTVPVIVGSDYKEYLHVGDKITCDYLTEDLILSVEGILEENQFYYDEMAKEFKSFDRYMILPALFSENASDFDKMRLLLQVGGMIVSDLGYPEVEKIFSELKKENDVEDLNMYMEKPEDVNNSVDLFENYSSMTQEVSKQFQIISDILLIFVIISISSVLCGIIREKNYEYGIRLLCGAKITYILGDILFIDFFVMLLGGLLAIGFLGAFDYSLECINKVILTSGFICILVAGILIRYFFRLDIGEIIGGKE